MKLFLTSSGLNDANEKDFLKLLGCDPQGLRVAFIPTATNVEFGKKITEVILNILPDWMIQDISDLKRLGMNIEFINLEDLSEENIVSTFKPFDIIYVYGGNTFYLMKYANESGFKKYIKEIVKDKVYVGVSAGSVIAGQDIEVAQWGKGGDRNIVDIKDMSGLGLVDFCIIPHYKDQIFNEIETYPYEVRYIKDGEVIII